MYRERHQRGSKGNRKSQDMPVPPSISVMCDSVLGLWWYQIGREEGGGVKLDCSLSSFRTLSHLLDSARDQGNGGGCSIGQQCLSSVSAISRQSDRAREHRKRRESGYCTGELDRRGVRGSRLVCSVVFSSFHLALSRASEH